MAEGHVTLKRKTARYRKMFIRVAATLAATFSVSFATAAVTIDYAQTRIYYGVGWENSSADPAGTTIALEDGPYRQTTVTTEFGSSGLSARVDQYLSLEGNGPNGGYGAVEVTFTADVDTPYWLNGAYSHAYGYSGFNVLLWDNAASVVLYEYSALDQSLNSAFSAELGTPAGNVLALENGTRTGTLVAGRQYTWSMLSSSAPLAGSGNSSQMNASASLKFEDPPTEIVPEPASIAVWSCLGLGIVGLVKLRRFRGTPTSKSRLS